ncbi:MAG: cytochrome c biogenesis protein [Bacteroidetes bacterium]|nr:cytochrome c biogenesis protein [Bacteroidota bacterium]
MDGIKFVLELVLPLLYLCTVVAYALSFFKQHQFAKRIKTVLLLVTIAVHLAYLLVRTFQLQHPPIISVFEILSLLAFSIAASYRLLEMQTKIKNTGLFVLSIALVFQIISSVFIEDVYEVDKVLRSNLLGIHVLSALLGYSAFTISAVYGVMYLLQYRSIKSNKFGIIFENLPSLERLEYLTKNGIIIGFILLSIAISIGYVWLPTAIENFSYFDPKLIGTIVIWGMYAVEIYLIQSGKRRGRQVMHLAISGFAFTLFSLTIINMYLTSFHLFIK